MQGQPKSARNWQEVAKEHPEFFRLNTETRLGISLVSRYVLPLDDAKRRPPLELETMQNLMRIAIDLHDRQVHRAERWQVWVPIIATVVGAIAGGVITIFSMRLQ